MQGGLGAVGAQLAMETASSRVIDHVNAQVRAVQRAFGVLADTLEDEVGHLRSADAQQWEQLKVHATQFNEVEELKAELERTRTELRTTQGAFAAFRVEEHATLLRRVDDLEEQLAEGRDKCEPAPISLIHGWHPDCVRMARAATRSIQRRARAPPRPDARAGERRVRRGE